MVLGLGLLLSVAKAEAQRRQPAATATAAAVRQADAEAQDYWRDYWRDKTPTPIVRASSGGGQTLNGHYFSFQTGGNPKDVVDRFEARVSGSRITYYRNGPVGSRGRVDSATAQPMESYEINGNQLHGPVSATVQPNGDIEYSHGYTSRKEAGGSLSVGATPSHGNPSSTSALNTELNNVARNTDDTAKARELVAAGASPTPIVRSRSELPSEFLGD